jgi:hypothetical protein
MSHPTDPPTPPEHGGWSPVPPPPRPREPYGYAGPGQPHQGWTPAAPPPKKRSWFARHKILTAALAVVGALALLGGIGAAVGGLTGSGAKSIASATATPTVSPTPPASSAASTPTDEPTPADYTPSTADFTLKFKTTSKQCFGDAGCTVEGKVDFASVSSRVPDDVSVLVTFEIRGAEDPLTDSIEIEGGRYDQPEEFFQTKSSGTKISVVVTEVEES